MGSAWTQRRLEAQLSQPSHHLVGDWGFRALAARGKGEAVCEQLRSELPIGLRDQRLGFPSLKCSDTKQMQNRDGSKD